MPEYVRMMEWIWRMLITRQVWESCRGTGRLLSKAFIQKVIDHLSNIDEIESRGHLDLLWELPGDFEAVIESRVDMEWARL